MPCALPTQYIYFFGIIIPVCQAASFQNSLKTRIKLHKIVSKMSKNCLRGVGEKWGGGRENWWESAMVVGGDRRPWGQLPL